MAIATLLGLQDRRVRNSHRRTISGNRWSRWRVRAFQHRRHSTSCVLLGQQRSSRSNTIGRSYNTLYKWDSHPAAQPSICQRTADAHFSSATATSPVGLSSAQQYRSGITWLAHVLVLHVASTIMLLIVTASAWRRQVQASFFCFYHACVTAVSDLGVPQMVRRKQFHHGQLSMLLSFKIFQHTSHNVRKFARRFTRIQCFCYRCSTAQHYQQLASHSFFSDEVGDCARSHDVVMCGSHSIEPGTCDNYVNTSIEFLVLCSRLPRLVQLDQARQSTAKHKKFDGSIHASSKMSRSGWVPFTQLPPSWRFLASLLVMLVCKMTH